MINIEKKTNFTQLLLLFFGGFSFLIFELSWFRLLSIRLGSTVFASTFVLSSYMLGIGFGSLYLSKTNFFAKKNKLLLSLVFLFIALFGALLFIFIDKGILLIYKLQSLSIEFKNIFVYSLSLLFLFLQAFFIGGVLPLFIKLLVKSKNSILQKISITYMIETIGSVFGGIITGFWLIRFVGQYQTIIIAISINLILAIFCFFYFRKNYFTTSEIEDENANADNQKILKKEKSSSLKIKYEVNNLNVYISSFTIGLVVMAVQVLFLRAFKTYLMNNTYSFSIISSVSILGLFLGGFIFKSIIRHYSMKLLNNLVIMICIATFISIIMIIKLPEFVFFPLKNLQENGFGKIIIIPLISAFITILPLSIISGIIFPLCSCLIIKNYEDSAKYSAKIIFINSIGSAAGPIIAAFVLIPLLGISISMIFLLFILLLLALITINKKYSTQNIFKIRLVLFLGIISALLVCIVKPKFFILPPSFAKMNKEILAYKETTEGTYIVGKQILNNQTVLSTYINNSSVIGSSYDAIKAVKMVGHLPFFTGLKCNKVLIVGFGIGVTTSAIASHKEVTQIDCVELVSGLKDVAYYYDDLNKGVYNDKRLNLISGDGFKYLQNTDKKYDLISSDPTHPILGSGNLYTKEYFEFCKNSLTDNGMVSQYLPLHKLLLKDLLGIIKTFNSVFNNTTVWFGQYHAILIGAKKNNKIDFKTWSTNIENIPKDPLFYNNPYHLASCLVLNNEKIKQLTQNIQINTINNNYTEFFNWQSLSSDNTAVNLKFLNKNRCSVKEVFYNIGDSTKVEKFAKSNLLTTEALYFMLVKDRENMKNKLSEGIKENPQDEELPFLLKIY